MNLFVGNLSPDTSEADLKKAFSEFGNIVSVKILIDPTTGMPRGFGFVEMAGKTEAYDAMLNLDCTYLKGTIISVKEAKPKAGPGGNSNGYNSGERPQRNSFAPRERFNRRF